MDMQGFRTLLLVRDLGSIAAAARALDIDASNVSRTVAAVERELGARLFQRSTRKLALTEEGDRYLRRIAPLLEEMDAAREEISEKSCLARGTLRLTASVAFTLEILIPLLPGFQERYPEISVELFPSDSNLDLLAEGLDLAVRLAAAPKGDMISTRLLRTRYRVVAAPGYLQRFGAPARPEDLAGRDCLRFDLPEFKSVWRFRRPGEMPSAVAVSGRTVISNALALREAARLGMGPALLADWLIDKDLADGLLVDLFPEHDCAAGDFDTGAWILYPSRIYLPRKVRVMIDFLKSELGRASK